MFGSVVLISVRRVFLWPTLPGGQATRVVGSRGKRNIESSLCVYALSGAAKSHRGHAVSLSVARSFQFQHVAKFQRRIQELFIPLPSPLLLSRLVLIVSEAGLESLLRERELRPVSARPLQKYEVWNPSCPRVSAGFPWSAAGARRSTNRLSSERAKSNKLAGFAG